MNSIPDLIPLHDSRAGLRTLLEVKVTSVEGQATKSSEAGQGAASASTSAQAAAHVLDFVASTATLDR